MPGSISPMWPVMSLRLGVAIERAGKDEAQDVYGGVDVPAEAGDAEEVGELLGKAAFVVAFAHGFDRDVGMQVDGHA